MRVIAGCARSLQLKTIEGLDTRPTTDRIKETLFNVLTGYTSDARFLDLFAGSGGIGIEALSRGAESCTFVELAPKAIGCITDNLIHTKLMDHANVIKSDAISYVAGLSQIDFDVIFMDPPYGKQLERSVLTVLADKTFVTDCLIVVEADIHEDFSYLESLGFQITKEKLYKSNKHVFIEKRNEE
ncbi:MAG: 16S rRNA (guanine(966)-N(2))-methyltransferase RsmD [Eubacteriales bacterium]|nr:16S rRNA (guanine(966)-N(2))-methyltransferase RsmD [Lachnospiraceae bacterium]MDO5126863.1 16S rRNA (guanine(966)-N(2))-methyltransferase RsmD [Eubacteriales bacterium]